MHKFLPRRAPAGSFAVASHLRAFDSVALRTNVQSGSPDEAEAGMIVSVVGKIVHGNSLSRQSIPDVHVKRKQRRYRRLIVRKKVLANLPMAIAQAARMRARFRQQQQARIFVGVSLEQNHFRRLEKLLTVP